MSEQNELILHASEAMPVQQIKVSDIDRLDNAEIVPVNLMSEYWSPEDKGECKKVIYDGIEPYALPDQITGASIDLDCVCFYVKENGITKRMRNGSKKLVGSFRQLDIKPGTAWVITYLGKKTNKTNPNKADDWSINPLIVPDATISKSL